MFGRIFTIVFLILLVADLYIFSLYIKKLTKRISLRILWFVPSAILLAGLYIFFYTDIGRGYRDIFMLTFIIIALPKIFFTIISLFDLPLRYFFKWKVYPFTILGLAVSMGIIYIAVYGSVAGKNKFEVNRIEYLSDKLPASFEGYRIAQLSDIHIGNWEGDRESIARMVEITNALHPDVIVVTGDLVHSVASELDGYEDILSKLQAKDGVYSILGNHDYGLYRRWGSEEEQIQNLEDLKKRQTNMGWKLLNNEHTYLVRNNDSIALIGVENDGSPPFPQYGDLPKAMKGVNKDKLKVLLSHDPTHWRREALGSGIDLMLAGHTHATQLAIGNFSPAAFVYPEWRGLYTEGDQALYVNVGIGHVGIPFRFGAWPEITEITLRQK